MSEKMYSMEEVLTLLEDYKNEIELKHAGMDRFVNYPDPTEFFTKQVFVKECEAYMDTLGRGLIINIEGVDGSGKHTQAELLKNAFTYTNIPVKIFSFPSYDKDNKNFTGALNNMMLDGKFGDINKVDPYSNTMFFLTDMIAKWYLEIEDLVDKGYVIILDRFYFSNIFHQATKIDDTEELAKYFDWFLDTIKAINMPMPDVIIYLGMKYEVIKERIAERAKVDMNHKTDIHEKDEKYMERCAKLGMVNAYKLSELFSNFRCLSLEAQDTKEEIHYNILIEIMKVLSIPNNTQEDNEKIESKSKIEKICPRRAQVFATNSCEASFFDC